MMMDDYGLLEAIRMSDLNLVKSIFQRKTNNKIKTQQLILSTLQRTTGGNRDVPLLLAATIEDTSILAYFVTECEVDLNKSIEIDSSFREYTYPIISAIKSENLKTLEWILNNDGNPEVVDGKGWSPLHHAVAAFNYSLVRRLLDKSIKNIDLENSDGQTALHMASRSGHLEIVKLLIDIGHASVGCARSFDGMAPIHVAAKEGHFHLVQLFCETYNVSAKSQYKCKSSDGKFYVLKGPLHVASSEGNASTVEVLMKFCEANSLDSVGNTPLHCCFTHKYNPTTMKPIEQYGETVKILLAHGCDTMIVNVKNEMASDLARDNGYSQLIELFNLPRKSLSLRNNKKEKSSIIERPPSAALVGSGSLVGHQKLDANDENVEPNETQPIKKVKKKSSSKRLNTSQQEDVGIINDQNQKPKPTIRKSISNEILDQASIETTTTTTTSVANKPSKIKKIKAIDPTPKAEDSEPELTTWLKEQAQLLKNRDTNEKTVPMAQSTPPPSKKSDKRLDSPTKSPKTLMSNSSNIQKVVGSKDKPKPLPPPKPFKKPNFTTVKVDSTESDNASLKDTSFEAVEPVRPVPRPRKNTKSPDVENKNFIKTPNDSFNKQAGGKNVHIVEANKTVVKEVKDNKDITGTSPVKKAVLPKKTSMTTMDEKVNGSKTETTAKLPLKISKINDVQSPAKKVPSPKKPINIRPPSDDSDDSDDDDDDDDEEEDSDDVEKVIPVSTNNNNTKKQPPKKINGNSDGWNVAVDNFKNKTDHRDEGSEEESEEEDEEEENSESSYEQESMEKIGDIQSTPFFIPPKVFTRTRAIEIARNSDKKLGISVVGGNHDGIFIHTVAKNLAAQLKSGEQIAEINGRSIAGKTKEDIYKLFETLVQNSERVALVLSDEGSEIYREIVKNNCAGGDRFYVRAKFSYDSGKKRELKIREGEIFCVTDSLPEKYDGLWKAQRMSTTIRKNDDIGVGYIPNRQKADQIALKQHLSSSANSRNGAFLRSFRRTKSAEKLSNKSGRLNESADAFNSSLTIIGYERVLQAPPTLKKRPVIILGLFCDVVLGMLTQDSPNLFFTPPSNVQFENPNLEFDDTPVDYQSMQKYMNLPENFEKRHLLTIMSPAAIDFLMKKTTLDPIVIFISPVSKSVVKAVKAKLAPNYDRNPSHLYEEASKFEKNYTHLFSSVVSYTADEWWFFHLKEAITHSQQLNVWVPEELAIIAQKKKQQQQKQAKAMHSSHNNLNAHKKALSQTFDNLQMHDVGNNRAVKPRTMATNNNLVGGPGSLPPRGKLLQQQSNPVPATVRADLKPLSSTATSKTTTTTTITKVEVKSGKTVPNLPTKNNANIINEKRNNKKHNDEDDDDDDEDDDEDEEEENVEVEEDENEEEDDDDDDEDEDNETEINKKKPDQLDNVSNAKLNSSIQKLESCPQAFGRDKRLASENVAKKSNASSASAAPLSASINKMNTDLQKSLNVNNNINNNNNNNIINNNINNNNTNKAKNMFVRPNQLDKKTTASISFGNNGFVDKSFDSDSSVSAGEIKNKKILFQRAASSSSKETPL